MVARFPRWACAPASNGSAEAARSARSTQRWPRTRERGGLWIPPRVLPLRVPLLLACLCLGACNRNKDPKADKPVPTKHGLTDDQAGQPLIVVGDTTVTVGQFAQQLAEKSPYLRARYASPERRRELLDELVKFELLAKEAARRGLDKSEEVQRAKRQVMVQQMMKAEFEDKVKLSDITDQEI